jgi:hypothetical protein
MCRKVALHTHKFEYFLAAFGAKDVALVFLLFIFGTYFLS